MRTLVLLGDYAYTPELTGLDERHESRVRAVERIVALWVAGTPSHLA